jgi:hypothetical protein
LDLIPVVVCRSKSKADLVPSIFHGSEARVPPYGFAGSDEYRKQGGAANVGLLDQRFAMEWVQKNYRRR